MLLFLILLGAPIGFILILIPFVYILLTDAVPLVLIPSQMFTAIDSVPLTAIAFFMLTGELMTSATITDRLVALSRALIGRIRGGLAQVNVLVSMFFAGMNGSVVADTATVGALVLPAMKKAGYPAAFSAAVTGVSSTIGGIIPPSIMMIVLANATEISIAALFAAGKTSCTCKRLVVWCVRACATQACTVMLARVCPVGAPVTPSAARYAGTCSLSLLMSKVLLGRSYEMRHEPMYTELSPAITE